MKKLIHKIRESNRQRKFRRVLNDRMHEELNRATTCIKLAGEYFRVGDDAVGNYYVRGFNYHYNEYRIAYLLLAGKKEEARKLMI